jgi:2-polyprenyl-3-methyl-5-hydroxy-6-metoxy-1,4-benzoquinol methylase
MKHTYDYEINMQGDLAPARVLRMIPPGSRVLEIGAGPGSMTKHLIGSLGCTVVAIEIEETAIEKLKEICTNVHECDLNNPSWVEQIGKKEGLFDYVIAADVLEHLHDPAVVLAGMKKLLNSTGSVILSLPHIGHAGVLGSLVDEDMAYGPWGLLDRTHIRFFGIKNVQTLHSSQGLAIEQAEFVVRTPAMTEFARRWDRLPSKVQEALQLNRFSHVYQVVCRSVPMERGCHSLDLMRLPVIPPDPITISRWTEIMAYQPVDATCDIRSTIEKKSVK